MSNFFPVLDLTNKNAIVCGSTSGIGEATATVLANLGAKITLIARNEEKLATIVNQLNTKLDQTHDYILQLGSNKRLTVAISKTSTDIRNNGNKIFEVQLPI
jgi:NADP-dependent 3-hydroxy acid dehydrogenase YdfG